MTTNYVPLLIILGSITIQLAATYAAYTIARDATSEYSPVSDAIMCFLLWWVVLPGFAVVAAINAVERREAIRKAGPPQLKSGTENGLYE